MRRYSTLKKFKKQNLRKMTKEESKLYLILRKYTKHNGLGILKRQFIIPPYIVDFFIRKLNLCIEIDGDYHNQRLDYDLKRDNFLKSLGMDTFRFTNEQINHHFEEVLKAIHQICLSRIENQYTGAKMGIWRKQYKSRVSTPVRL